MPQNPFSKKSELFSTIPDKLNSAVEYSKPKLEVLRSQLETNIKQGSDYLVQELSAKRQELGGFAGLKEKAKNALVKIKNTIITPRFISSIGLLMLNLGVHTTSVEAKNSKLRAELNNQTKAEDVQTQKTQNLKVDKLGNISLTDIADKNDLNTEITGSNEQINQMYIDGAFKLVNNTEGQKEVKVNLAQLKKSLGVKDKLPTIPENNNGAKRNVETQPPSANTEQPTESKPTQVQSTETQNPIVPNTTIPSSPQAPKEPIKGMKGNELQWYENYQSILAGLGIATLGGIAWWKKDKIRESTILLAYRAEQEYNKRIKKSKELLANLKKSNYKAPQSSVKEEGWSIKNVPFNLKNDFGTIRDFVTERTSKLKEWLDSQKNAKPEEKSEQVKVISKSEIVHVPKNIPNEVPIINKSAPEKISIKTRIKNLFELAKNKYAQLMKKRGHEPAILVISEPFEDTKNSENLSEFKFEEYQKTLCQIYGMPGIEYSDEFEPKKETIYAEIKKRCRIIETLYQMKNELEKHLEHCNQSDDGINIIDAYSKIEHFNRLIKQTSYMFYLGRNLIECPNDLTESQWKSNVEKYLTKVQNNSLSYKSSFKVKTNKVVDYKLPMAKFHELDDFTEHVNNKYYRLFNKYFQKICRENLYDNLGYTNLKVQKHNLEPITFMFNLMGFEVGVPLPTKDYKSDEFISDDYEIRVTYSGAKPSRQTIHETLKKQIDTRKLELMEKENGSIFVKEHLELLHEDNFGEIIVDRLHIDKTTGKYPSYRPNFRSHSIIDYN